MLRYKSHKVKTHIEGAVDQPNICFDASNTIAQGSQEWYFTPIYKYKGKSTMPEPLSIALLTVIVGMDRFGDYISGEVRRISK